MLKILAIVSKELKVLFHSPMAYIILILTLSVFNVFFFMIIDQNQEATLRDMFKLMEFLFVFIVPLLTMKMIAEEKAMGTIEFLMTSTLTTRQLVLGKYLACCAFLVVLFVPTGVYYFIVGHFGKPDLGASVTGYVGIILEAFFFVAVGILCSSWTRHQVMAAICTYIILFGLYFSQAFLKYINEPNLKEIITTISTLSHLENFAQGIVNLSDVVYYVSGIIFCLFLTKLSLDFQKK